MTDLVVALFVGGRGSRLGHVAKGLLRTADGTTTLSERLCREVRRADPSAELLLVGNADAYGSLCLPAVTDAPSGIGPLGGLLGVLTRAADHGRTHVLALACDLPYLKAPLIGRLARESPAAWALLVRQDQQRNPLICRYAVTPALAAARSALAAGAHSLQAVLDRLLPHVAELHLGEGEDAELRDWDTPEDVARAHSSE